MYSCSKKKINWNISFLCTLTGKQKFDDVMMNAFFFFKIALLTEIVVVVTSLIKKSLFCKECVLCVVFYTLIENKILKMMTNMNVLFIKIALFIHTI